MKLFQLLVAVVFQFPPNGKAHVNTRPWAVDATDYKVSIPSEREGTCELNGELSFYGVYTLTVSIPSEREGTCEPLGVSGLDN